MYQYNISKYNPDYRDNFGRYLNEDWTAISDIGKSFNGKVLTSKDYLDVEDNYVKAIYEILNFHNLRNLHIKDVRKSFEHEKFIEVISKRKIFYTNDLLKLYDNLEFKKVLDYQDIDPFCRLLLREDIGAKLFYPRKLKIFICYDYLLGIHSNRSIEKVILNIKALALYVEEMSNY